jgi:hypothetical protein
MLPRAEIAKIRAKIEASEKARENCTDILIRKLIEDLDRGTEKEVGFWKMTQERAVTFGDDGHGFR